MGYLLAVVAAVLWATGGILGKFLYRYGADPLTVVTIRAVIAFVTLAAILSVVDRRLLRIRRQDIPYPGSGLVPDSAGLCSVHGLDEIY